MIERLPEEYPRGTPAAPTLERFSRVVNQVSEAIVPLIDATALEHLEPLTLRLPVYQGEAVPREGEPGEVRLWWNPVTSQVALIARVAGEWRKMEMP